MHVSKIKKKYCANNKVQIMYSNAPSQIIFSKDGYLYLREKEVTIHRYLTDPVRDIMPYKNKPTSENHATHLFEFDKIYAKFTRYRNMGVFYYPEDSYTLTFLYHVKAKNGDVICAEIDPEKFKAEGEVTRIFSKEELEKFLYGLEDEDAKCIFEYFGGIQYARHSKEKTVIKNESFLELSDDAIVRRYNLINQPMYALTLDKAERAKMEADESWKIQNVAQIRNFVLTNHGLFESYSPMLLVVKGEKMYLYNFKVTLIMKDFFELKYYKRTISLSYNDIIRYANNCEHPPEPHFDE